MAAGLGFKTFTSGEVLTAADVNGYLMQGVGVFTDAANRDAEITSPQEGQFAYLKDTNVTTYYTGSAWANLDTTGMTNPMTTTGDTIYSSSGSTPARLGIGTTGQVLTVSGGIPSWATASSGGMTLLSTTTLTGSSVTIGSIPATYNDLQLIITAFTPPSQHYQAIDLYTGSNSSVGGYILYDIDSISTTSVITSGSGKFYTSRPQAPGWNSTNATSHTVVNVYDYARTGVKHIIHSVTGYTDGNGTNRTALAFGCSENTGAINAINISTGLGGSFTGTAYLYGVK